MQCPHCGKPIDPIAARFNAGRHRYPDLVANDLGHLWRGPGYNDFAPELIHSAQKFLRKHSLPAEKGDAINAIRNKVRQADWGWLDQRWEERHRPQATQFIDQPQAEEPEIDPTSEAAQAERDRVREMLKKRGLEK